MSNVLTNAFDVHIVIICMALNSYHISIYSSFLENKDLNHYHDFKQQIRLQALFIQQFAHILMQHNRLVI